MTSRFFIFVLLLSCFSHFSFGQKNDAEAALYNIGVGAVFSTIGAIINKKPNEKLDKVILKSFLQGGMGGYVTFESKRLLRPACENEDWKLYWSSKLLNAAGTSIIENAGLNRNFWEQWNLNIGFVRLEFHTKDRFSFQPKILPITLIHTIGATLQTDFEKNRSFQTGQLVFSSNNPRFEATNSVGVTYSGLMVLKNGYTSNYELISHEIIHIYQQNDLNVLNTYYYKSLNNVAGKNKFIGKFNQYVHSDLQFYLNWLLNTYENSRRINYYDNFLEHEAGYFSNTLF